MIRSGRVEQSDYLCSLIRSGVALPDIASHVEKFVNADPELLQLSQEIMRSNDEFSPPSPGAKRTIEDRIRPQSLILPPISMSAYPWTTLASDEVFSHLLSIYFTWEQPCLQFIDKTAFLADMKATDVSRPNTFCSSLLVSALLAQACVSRPFSAPLSLVSTNLVLIASSSLVSAQNVKPFEHAFSARRKSVWSTSAGELR